MDFLQTLGNIAILFLIAGLNGFFTASGFALVKIRSTQIDALVAKGHRRAKVTRDILNHLDVYLSATQFGNVLTSIALGWLGEPFVARALGGFFQGLGIANPAMIEAISFGIAFGFVSFLNIIIGEMVPKSLAIQKAKSIVLFVAYPLRLFFTLFKPFISVLNFFSALVLKALGLGTPNEVEIAHSTEELRLLLTRESGVPSASKSLVINALDFRRKQARHAMVPRPDIVALALGDVAAENIERMRRHKFSRYPVFSETIDNIVGIVHTKDIFKTEIHHQPDFRIDAVLRDAVFLPETVPLQNVLETILQKKTHMVILSDEYGGTAGLITLEDILEELVGAIQDEFDRESPEVTKISDDEFVVDASITTHDVEQLIGQELSFKDIRSIGGFLIEEFGHIPTEGERLSRADVEFSVERADERVIERVRIKRRPRGPSADHAAREN
jgi:CBS domain containing-hemolysin-like protein